MAEVIEAKTPYLIFQFYFLNIQPKQMFREPDQIIGGIANICALQSYWELFELL